jgi:OFA family oxalate/formate antiporter-like MFS transporter
VESTIDDIRPAAKNKFFYGWYIVGVGFLANVASAFSLASTMSVFLKPLTADLGVSRGVFSLLRSGEGLIAAFLAPVIGTLMDRYGGRWLMVFGAIIASLGYIVLSHVDNFSQFSLVRLSLITIGDSFMGYIVVNVAIAHWFSRKRGRALALTSMGIGFAKVVMPVLAASLIVWLGWRQTWLVFGVVTLVLVVGPALLIVRRSPEDMGLHPDGALAAAPKDEATHSAKTLSITQQATRDNIEWTRNEALHTQTFWLLVITFGISSIGVTGLNLHVFPYVNDLGHPPVVAATVMSVIASMQLASPIAWGILAERIDTRFAAMLRFVVQGIGLGLAIMTDSLFCLYAGFFLYGIGLGGNMVLPDILWANYFGRRSLGKVRGLGLLISQTVAALGPPFFGFLFDLTGAYDLSFVLFGAALITSAFLSLMLRPPVRI